ncbi:DUF411 domain-containing protein [Phenylobacterium deserti]|uniref:DUF411 domain-containing protein n=1 Tax=Phenylobacterium deserti TaxID=1914756 RepID=A0A328ANJ9_9CAUL|nr:DUF411 domain-containing protein [Phenylobacterium deserti]RAK56592.1 DUF411 domain-containing protein [Phenylobacterium deserti]
MFNRRTLLAAAPMLALAGVAHAAPRTVTVWKTSSCGCCKGWISTMSRAGFHPKVVEVEDVSPIWRKHGVPDELSSCHVAQVGGYVTVGHVPPADIERLLREKPKAIGLTVPGMPIGSPGMEARDGRKEAYNTFLLLPGGKTRVFARHA